MIARARSVHRSVYILIAAGALLVGDVSGITISAQIATMAALVALLGIPHGALDPVLAHESNIARTPRELARFLLLYVSLASLVVATWWAVPAMALAGFLFLSIWHFGGDWRELLNWQATSGAATVVCAPAVFHPVAVQDLFSMLLFGAEATWLIPLLQVLGAVALVGLAIAVPAVATKRPRVALELLTLPMLAWLLPPLLFFVVYFCCLHSPRHIIDSLAFVTVRRSVIVMTGLAMTALTVSAATAAFLLLPAAETATRMMVIVFVGLAALTVPHMLLIEQTNKALHARSTR